MAILSLMGLYDHDPTLFEDLTLPTAADITGDANKVANPWVPDKQTFIDYLVMECAELELVYPSLPTLKKMISIWAAVRLPVWKALYNTLLYSYNPIWNKDGTITETHNFTGSDIRTPNLITADQSTVTNMQTVNHGTNEHDVTGYNANSFSPDTLDTTNATSTTNGATGNTRTETGTDEHEMTDAGTMTRTEGGNIGVTMTQDMIQKQRDIVMFNLYETIALEFKNKFCLLVY